MSLTPRVSVLCRSYNRPEAVTELLTHLLAQDHDSYEVVVVEQTEAFTPAQRAALEPLWADPRVRVFWHPPLGGARARNLGIRACRGDIVILIDDDDLPAGNDWIRVHEGHYKDPNLVGVSARQVRAVGEACPYSPALRPLMRRIAMRFSSLGVPHVSLPRLDEDIDGVDWVNGTNGSVRREVALRIGLWDESVRALEEHSFGYRFRQYKKPGQYFAWRKEPTIVRRIDVRGGMDKRDGDLKKELTTQLNFTHRIVQKYHPQRFRRAYPAYLASALVRSLAFVWDYDWFDHSARERVSRTGALLKMFPGVVREVRAQAQQILAQGERANDPEKLRSHG